MYFSLFPAQALDDALTLYFSHPAVEGIMLWGFWDGRMFEQSAALVEGPDLTVRYTEDFDYHYENTPRDFFSFKN